MSTAEVMESRQDILLASWETLKAHYAFLSLEDLMVRYRVSRRTLERLMSEGQGPKSCRIGRQFRFPVDAVEEWEKGRLK